ncbi:metal ABC transporter permease [Cognatishimia activa]|uniref:Manganese transport system membrane protein MntB n=1 Tax=Cognatishimia activa TaxID=1715691 RepID=A0A0P1IZT1_9RHOB|nr:metal ABC transporter permease [Cognatishimia activa]CUJ29888.1 Manganese transport system membrane protein MntB [Cognatishimia activa]CUK27221.1 Manganese transport system membrane protein MntB [Cognatishimia activa]
MVPKLSWLRLDSHHMDPVEFFSNHIFRMVFLGTTVIGLVAGALGAFAYLRKQSLISDVIGHAALPGALLAFLAAVTMFGVNGRSMLLLVIGAVITGTLAALFANTIAARTKVAIDTAMAISMTTFFGFGMLLLRFITNNPFPGKGGIQDYLFGNAASITRADLTTSIAVGALAMGLMVVFWKEFTLRSFDPVLSTMLGFKARIIDTLMFTTIVIAIVIGVKAVGFVLMVAFVVTPPAAARQWTNTLPGMVMLSGLIGGLGSGFGAYLSISLGNVPTGPVIVLVLFAILLFSLLASPKRSVVITALRRMRARRALKQELISEGSTR